MRPLIGVFTSERHAGQLATLQRCDESAPATELRLGMPYLRAIELGGGIPVVLAPETAAAAEVLLDRLDGLCLAGGPDLDPLEYGAADRHGKLGPTDRVVDAAEVALVRGADARGLPLLGICRGPPGAERRPRRHAAPARRRPSPDDARDGGPACGRRRRRLAARGRDGRGGRSRSTPSTTRPPTCSAPGWR